MALMPQTLSPGLGAMEIVEEAQTIGDDVACGVIRQHEGCFIPVRLRRRPVTCWWVTLSVVKDFFQASSSTRIHIS